MTSLPLCVRAGPLGDFLRLYVRASPLGDFLRLYVRGSPLDDFPYGFPGNSSGSFVNWASRKERLNMMTCAVLACR